MDPVLHSCLCSVCKLALSPGKYLPSLPINVAFHVVFKGKTGQIVFDKGYSRTADCGAYGQASSSDEAAFPEYRKLQRAQQQAFYLKQAIVCYCLAVSKFVIVCK